MPVTAPRSFITTMAKYRRGPVRGLAAEEREAILTRMPTDAPSPERQGALHRVRWASCVLADAAKALADPDACERDVARALEIADATSIVIKDGKPEHRAVMQFLHDIAEAAEMLVAHEVLIPPTFILSWPEYAQLRRDKYLAAVQAWARSAGSRGGKSAEKWRHVCDAVESATGWRPVEKTLMQQWSREIKKRKARADR